MKLLALFGVWRALSPVNQLARARSGPLCSFLSRPRLSPILWLRPRGMLSPQRRRRAPARKGKVPIANPKQFSHLTGLYIRLSGASRLHALTLNTQSSALSSLTTHYSQCSRLYTALCTFSPFHKNQIFSLSKLLFGKFGIWYTYFYLFLNHFYFKLKVLYPLPLTFGFLFVAFGAFFPPYTSYFSF